MTREEEAAFLELQRVKRDAVSAQQLLDDELLVAAFGVLEAQWLKALRYFDPKTPEVAVMARLKLEALDLVRGQLKNLVMTGKLLTLEEERRVTSAPLQQ